MCGILGVINLKNNSQSFNRDLFIKMNDTMVHRGPDGEGFLFASKDSSEKPSLLNDRKNLIYDEINQDRLVYLAHRRLSIVDLDIKAGQPMGTPDKKVWLTFNGEVYNHTELRAELEKKGYTFKTHHSDTEVILYSYMEWGQGFVHKLRGMFAIAVWDSRDDSLILIRDRVGIKPLYYTVHNDRLYFGSEIKAMIEDTSIPKELNKKGLYDYLSFLTVPAPNTLFKNIYKIPAGHKLIIKNGVVSELIEYWDVFDEIVDLKNKSEEQIKEELIDELKESVSLRMGADVPVGVFLSGGIDSSLNAALFTEMRNKPVSSFSVGYENDSDLTSYTNEFKYSSLMAKQLNSDYHEKYLTQQMLIDFIPDLIHFQDEPIADPVCFPVYNVSKLAKENGVTVCQVGEGSDELFWGYSSWKVYYYLHLLNKLPVPSFLKKGLLWFIKKIKSDQSPQYELLRRGANKEPIFWSGAEAFTEQQKRRMLSKEFLKEIGDYSSYEVIKSYREKFLKKAHEKSFLNWMAYTDLKLRLPELLLMRVDKMGMAVSLEARVPFLDHKFVSYALSIPSKFKTKKLESKYILKKAVEGILPHEIIYRKKQGFGAPVHDWFMEDLGENAKESILTENITNNNFNEEYLKTLFASKNGTQAWYLYNYSEWSHNNIQN